MKNWIQILAFLILSCKNTDSKIETIIDEKETVISLPNGIKLSETYSEIIGTHDECTGCLDIHVDSGKMNLPDSVIKKLKIRNDFYMDSHLSQLTVVGNWPYKGTTADSLSSKQFMELVSNKFRLYGKLVDVDQAGRPIFFCDSLKMISKKTINKSAEPTLESEVALKFLNAYVSRKPEGDYLDWLKNRTDVTEEFILLVSKMEAEAKISNPEIGLGFDPILDAQDNPDSFKIKSIDGEYVILIGTKWTSFEVIVKLKYIDNKWLIDGSGAVNIDKTNKIKR